MFEEFDDVDVSLLDAALLDQPTPPKPRSISAPVLSLQHKELIQQRRQAALARLAQKQKSALKVSAPNQLHRPVTDVATSLFSTPATLSHPIVDVPPESMSGFQALSTSQQTQLRTEQTLASKALPLPSTSAVPSPQLYQPETASAAGVYVLRLHGVDGSKDYYYIGKSDNIPQRIKQHKTCGSGCASWVRHHGGVAAVEPPLTPREQIDSWEQTETIARIMKHGFDRVRGWEWSGCAPFTRDDYVSFKKCAFGTGDLCRQCGNPGHFASNCESPTSIWLAHCNKQVCEVQPQVSAKTVISNLVTENNSSVPRNTSNKKRARGCCERCGRNSHATAECYAQTDSRGEGLPEDESSEDMCWCCEYCGREFDTQRGAAFHENFHCHAKGRSKKGKSKQAKGGCDRCGRSTHSSYGCYAKVDVDGNWLGD